MASLDDFQIRGRASASCSLMDMQRHDSLQCIGGTVGPPYGPDNPPPPLARLPPNQQTSKRNKATRRGRSASPRRDSRQDDCDRLTRHQYGHRQSPNYQYRERSPRRRDYMDDEEHGYREQLRRDFYNAPSPRYRDGESLRGYDDQSYGVESHHSDRREHNMQERAFREYHRPHSPRRDDRSDPRRRTRPSNWSTSFDKNGHFRIPGTALSLRKYTDSVAALHSRDVNAAGTENLRKFKNGDGKVNPSAYGSTLNHDLGLCYTTFKTHFTCEMGVRCPWRHHPLTQIEKDWLRYNGGRGEKFIEEARENWGCPRAPWPGANMVQALEKQQFQSMVAGALKEENRKECSQGPSQEEGAS